MYHPLFLIKYKEPSVYMIPLNLHVYYRNATTGGLKQKIVKTKGKHRISGLEF